MSEADLQQKVIDYLESLGGWVLNVHGSAMTKRGTPDLLVCMGGRFWGIELKQPGEMPTALQIRRLRQIARAGGMPFLWSSMAEAKGETAAAMGGHSWAATAIERIMHKVHCAEAVSQVE